MVSWLGSLWKFSRPHTIIGTTLSVWAIYLIALASQGNGGNLVSFGAAVGAWAACIAGNIYIVGLNQLEDIAIDQINKPDLPLASGEFTPGMGKKIIGVSGLIAVVLAAVLGKELLFTIIVSLAIGTAYSLPPIRLKRFPFFAALCILTVRGVVVNLGLYWYFQRVLNLPEGIPIPIWLLTGFIVVFSVAIAIFKDVPDLEGDKQYKITTLPLLLGRNKVFTLSLILITTCYLLMIGAAFLAEINLNRGLLILIHSVLIGLLWWRSLTVDLEQKQSISKFYQFIWKLFFLEYLLFPLTCWWGKGFPLFL